MLKHALLVAALLQAVVLDRVAVSVGTAVITESQLAEEIKLDSFLNMEPAKFTVAAKRAAADRLIDQKLIDKEMQMGHYPAAPVQEASAMIEKLLKARANGKEQFDAQLSAAGITLAELQDHLLWGLTLARFVDLRFRPAVQVTRRDVEKYYSDKFLASAQGQKPKLDDVRDQIEKTLMADRSDEQLDAWLKDTRLHTTIVYAPEVFGSGSAGASQP